MRMLEIGPREKPMLAHFEGEHEVTYLDAVDRADGKNVVVHTLKYPMSPLPFPDKSFDLVFVAHVLEHFPYYQEKAVFDDLYRVLDWDGQLQVRVPDGRWIGERLVADDWERNFKGYMFGGLIDEYDIHFNVFTPRSLYLRLVDTGFVVHSVVQARFSMKQGDIVADVQEIQAIGIKKQTEIKE